MVSFVANYDPLLLRQIRLHDPAWLTRDYVLQWEAHHFFLFFDSTATSSHDHRWLLYLVSLPIVIGWFPRMSNDLCRLLSHISSLLKLHHIILEVWLSPWWSQRLSFMQKCRRLRKWNHPPWLPIFKDAEGLEVLVLAVDSHIFIRVKILVLESAHCFKEAALWTRENYEVIFIRTLYAALLIVFTNGTKVPFVDVHGGYIIIFVYCKSPEEWKELLTGCASVSLALKFLVNLRLAFLVLPRHLLKHDFHLNWLIDVYTCVLGIEAKEGGGAWNRWIQLA